MSKAKFKLGKRSKKLQTIVIVNQKENGLQQQGIYEYQGSRDEVHCKIRNHDHMGILMKCKRIGWCNPCCNSMACHTEFIPKIVIPAEIGLDLESVVLKEEAV